MWGRKRDMQKDEKEVKGKQNPPTMSNPQGEAATSGVFNVTSGVSWQG
jgi:hypothetical protein